MSARRWHLVARPASAETFTLNADGSFSYKANDGQADSNIATVTITVRPASK